MSKRKLIETGSEAKRWKDQGVNDSDSVAQPSRRDFVYEPLDHNSDSIRIIELHPDSADTTMRCTMRHVSLSEAQYTCLSYTWQPSHPQHVIEVNGRSLSVGENLYQFLRAYRSHRTRELPHPHIAQTHTLWIDAICIRQADTNEKNHQVRQMGVIYKKAASVLVWLGILGHATKEFLADIHRLATVPIQNTEREAVDWSSTRDDWEIHEERAKQYLYALDHTHASRASGQVLVLCENAYWSRVWIAQEVLLPSKYRVFVFDGAISHQMVILSEYLSAIAVGVAGSPRKEPFGLRYFDWRSAASQFHQTSHLKPSLSSLLSLFASCGCQEKRDRIFALLPLADTKPCIEIDYDTDLESLFREILGLFMTENTIDEVMILGAQLIEALELRGPTATTNDITSIELDISPVLDTRSVNIRRPPIKPVAPLVWSQSTLALEEPLEEPYLACYRQSTSCVFVGIFDAENVHILEYAVDKKDPGVVVRYARALEYQQGILVDVHYLRGPFVAFMDRASEPPLSGWTESDVEILEDMADNAKKTRQPVAAQPRMKTAEPDVSILDPVTGDSHFFDREYF